MAMDEKPIVAALLKALADIDGTTTERILHQCIKASREQRYFDRTYDYPQEWRPVLRPRFEQYLVSNWGYVRLESKSIDRILRPAFEHEYTRVGLSAPWRKRAGAMQHMVHELVAESFILGSPIPEELRVKKSLQVVNHIDGDKWHPAFHNLEITSHGDNMRHAYSTNLRDGRGSYGT